MSLEGCNLSGMPQITSAFGGWMQRVSLTKVAQSINDGLVENSELQITFTGTIQPLSPKELMLKPDYERAWTWLQIHCVSGRLDLNPNDIIVYNGKNYKIMAIKDYSLNSYIEYHAVADYKP